MPFCLPAPHARRGFIAVLALLGQVVSAFGMPLPSLGRRKDTSRPFPCMSHSCGCMNIEDFWHNCCCYTNSEKLAWAEANGVSPPEFVQQAAEREQTATRQARKKSCCCDDRAGSCCAHEAAADNSCPRCAKEKQEKSASVKWMFGFAAKRCGGHGPFVAAQQSPSIPAAPPGRMTFDIIVLEMLHAFNEHARPLPAAPAVPPPRIG